MIENKATHVILVTTATAAATITTTLTKYLDSMRMLNWQSLIFILPGLLAYTWPGDNKSSGHNELFVLGMHNHTAWGMTLWQDNSLGKITCLLWLKELHSSQCPFVKLLVHCVIALPVYNLLLILIGWHLNRSATGSAERMLLVLRPAPRRPVPTPPLVIASPASLPPLPPPRCKRRSAPKPAFRQMRSSLNPPDKYPSQMDPFSTVDHAEQYKNLRRNLIRVLEGLQQPVPAISQLPLPWPMPVAMPLFNPRDPIEREPIQSPISEQLKAKKKSRKWFQTVVKRLSKPFAKHKSHDQVQDGTEVTPSNSSSSSNKNSSIIQMGWKRLKTRASRRSQFYVPSASSSETISSASCIYAY